MPADIAQKIEIVEVVQPFGVIKHQRAIWRIVIGHVGGKHAFDPRDVFVNLFGC